MLAPHVCLGCGQEGSTLCRSCMQSDIMPSPAICYRCERAVDGSRICAECSALTGIDYMYIASQYGGLAKDLTKQLKFHNAKAAATDMAYWIDAVIPPLNGNLIACPLPTAPKRARIRGYDQAVLIAKNLAKRRRLAYKSLLVRIATTRQVGANRHERQLQMQNAFKIKDPDSIRDKHILLIDDVVTTGSTFESAAELFNEAGARSVSALAFAYQAKAAVPSASNTRTYRE